MPEAAAQVKTDFAGGQVSASYGQLADDPLSEGLVGYWKMDETSTPLWILQVMAILLLGQIHPPQQTENTAML